MLIIADYWCLIEELGRTADLAVKHLGTTRTMAEVVAYENDEGVGYATYSKEGERRRYQAMLAWVQGQIRHHRLNRPGQTITESVKNVKRDRNSSAITPLI